ncbi:MAG: DUF4830 domain-containing protein [Oscillospiraceae bacterium]|jgi:hypothetical protein|nr:DUF4830 domain-containing protein [Oscillospiraceae bacterium]
MIVFSAKFNKKRAVIAVLVLAIILLSAILVAGRAHADKQETQTSLSATVKDNESRIKYLNAQGWEVEAEPIEEQTVVIPREFSSVYEQYNKLQLEQGFDLSQYGGIEAVRYTYRVTNYPDAGVSAVVDLIVYNNAVIAGDVQSNALDGFMVGLKYPAKK